MGYLERMLKMAQDTNVPLILVDMPLTQANLTLLPPALLSDYHKRLYELTSKYGAVLYEPLASNDYPKTHFQDLLYERHRRAQIHRRSNPNYYRQQPHMQFTCIQRTVSWNTSK